MSEKKESLELEIEGDIFYVVDTEKRKWIVKREEDAIERMKKVAKEEDIDLEKTAIWEVDTSEKGKWEIKQVPWSKIAQRLLRGK
jgi:hypothetical protein